MRCLCRKASQDWKALSLGGFELGKSNVAQGFGVSQGFEVSFDVPTEPLDGVVKAMSESMMIGSIRNSHPGTHDYGWSSKTKQCLVFQNRPITIIYHLILLFLL